MVKNGDADHAAGGHKAPGDAEILGRRVGFAGGMIVAENYGRRVQF